MTIPTEPIGSIPRPAELIDGMQQLAAGRISQDQMRHLYDRAIRDTIRRLEETGSPIITEGRAWRNPHPSKQLLRSFVALNNRVLDRFTADERSRIGVHTCPGGDHDSTHSADVDYAELLPDLFRLQVRNFYIQLASERNRTRVLRIIKENAKADQRVFVGVTDPIDPKIETPEEVRDRVLEAAEIIPLSQLGTTDDCGFSPFADDTSTARETAFAKIRARVAGTKLAEQALTSTTTAARPQR